MKRHDERNIFDIAGPMGPVRVEAGDALLRIAGGKRATTVPVEKLMEISARPGSWRFGSSTPVLWLKFRYLEGGREKKTEIALAPDSHGILEFLGYLDRRYPGQSCLGPNQREKDRILSRDWRGVYSLHALSVLTPAGIFLGIFLVSILILSIILAEPVPTYRLSSETLQKTRLVFLGLALVPAALMVLIASKKLLVLRTGSGGLTIRKLFRWKRFDWRAIEIGEPRSDCFNVYTGIACYYSGTINVVAQRRLVEVPILQGGAEVFTLKLNLEEAGPLFRELYYRGKVTRQAAQQAGGLI